MKRLKLATSFEFDSAHRLVDYNGKCSNLHGHIWRCEIEIYGNQNHLDDVGILWDFTHTKELKEMFDHKTILKNCEENESIYNAIEKTCGEGAVYVMKENPTAENLCNEILEYCIKSNRELNYKVRVYESPKSYAEIEG